jgi:predicted TPR repeat methyltransferase
MKSKEYWENRYKNGGNSGLGSSGNLAEYKAQVINNFIKKNKIDNLIEYGCGDGNNLSKIDCDRITGIDVSRTAINLCKNKMPEFKYDFICTDDVGDWKYDEVSDIMAELVLSLDVIYHLVEDSVYDEYMNNLGRMSRKWLIIYSNDDDDDVSMAEHVKWRKFSEHKSIKDNFILIKKEVNKLGNKADFFFYERKSKSS